MWRKAHSRQWDQEDMVLAGSAVTIVRLILEYEAVQQEMAFHARIDTLTGLLNRRALLEEIACQAARLDREATCGTLLSVDIDAFKSVNSRLGRPAGDTLLAAFADMLRNLVRPFDLIARLGGDEFAIWLSGADHMTAAERADELCKTAPAEMRALLGQPFPELGVSIGLATRRSGSREAIEALLRRADHALHEVKRDGRGHWRMSLGDV
jgi:diguanylate cyclase (GGDEF)-like protein